MQRRYALAQALQVESQRQIGAHIGVGHRHFTRAQEPAQRRSKRHGVARIDAGDDIPPDLSQTPQTDLIRHRDDRVNRLAQGRMIAGRIFVADQDKARGDVFERAAQYVFGNGLTQITAQTVQRFFVEICGIARMQDRDLLHHVKSFLTPTRRALLQSSLANW